MPEQRKYPWDWSLEATMISSFLKVQSSIVPLSGSLHKVRPSKKLRETFLKSLTWQCHEDTEMSAGSEEWAAQLGRK